MTPERWRQVEELYHAALAQDPQQRTHFLVHATETDEDLRREVESLLAQEISREGVLDRPAWDGALLPPSTEIATGTQLGPYLVEALLASGGMGHVYRGHDIRLGRAVAIKIVAWEFSSRFEDEARAISALNHPRICTLYDVGPGYLVMELVEGETLAARSQKGRLPIEMVCRYGAEIADALAAAHTAGIIHGDLKPGNLMVTKSGMKVLDFGLAKTMQKAQTTASSQLIQGTLAYMAPEQLEAEPCDARTDIFALGLVLYEMATGQRRKQGEAVNLGVLPERFAHVLERCLKQDPEDRWQSARDVQAELEWAGKPVPPERSSKRSPRWMWPVAALACAAIAIALLLRLLDPGNFSPEPIAIEFSVFPEKGTTFPLGAGGPWPSISPDGRYLAFIGLRPNGEQQVWVRSLGSSIARPLPGTQGARRPFWSPDSRSIAYFADDQLRRVDRDSGATRVICEAPYLGGLTGAWGEEDVILFPKRGGLYRVAAGGGPASLAVPDTGDTKPHMPSFLPGGQRFLYLAWAPRPDRSRVCTASLHSAETTCYSNLRSGVQYAPPGYLLFLEDQRLMALSFDLDRLKISGEPVTVSSVEAWTGATFLPPQVSVSSNGVMVFASPGIMPLAWLDRSGVLLEAAGTGTQPAVSRDGRRIAVARVDRHKGTTDVWLYDRERGTESRFTFDPSNDAMPVFSPDGEHVLFISDRSGTSQFYVKPSSGAGNEKLVASNVTNPWNLDWSSDGRSVLYQVLTFDTVFDLWAFSVADVQGLSAAEGTKPYAVARTEHGEREGRLSPDVRWVAYDSTESGRREVWVQRFPPTGSKWQISTTGGSSPRWRGDGKELFYVAADGMLTSVAIDAERTFQSGAPQPLFQTMFRGGVSASYTVSPDGTRFLMNVPPGADVMTPITVVTNWTSLLQK
jgi:eukaryotic-like serine/threonine-protein kinase